MIKVHCTFFNRLYKTTSIFLVSKDIKIIFSWKQIYFCSIAHFCHVCPGGRGIWSPNMTLTWGIWTPDLTRGIEIWTTQTSKVQMPGGLPGRGMLKFPFDRYITALPSKRQTDVRYFKDFPVCIKRETKARKKNRRLNSTVLPTIFILRRRKKTKTWKTIWSTEYTRSRSVFCSVFSKHPVLLGEQNWRARRNAQCLQLQRIYLQAIRDKLTGKSFIPDCPSLIKTSSHGM